MLFNSLHFLVFFIVVYSLYLMLPHRGQNYLLLAASYYFYGSWDWRFLSLILLSTTIDYFTGGAIARSTVERRRRAWLAFSVVSNLTILGFFKYFNFFVDSALHFCTVLGFEVAPRHLNIILPVGISFYTFQCMSYSIDVYRGHVEPVRHFPDFMLFVSLFPQLVAGPIERASHLLPQVVKPRQVVWSEVQSGAWLVLWGLFKKMVVADNLSIVVDQAFRDPAPTAVAVLLGVYAFALQIFCDFSAYSDIARGVGKFMGFDLMVNFRNPYLALNPSDFWRRWHISLSTWLRDYLYIPLGGNRRGERRTYLNLMLTMVLGGLWHGAAWTFIWWGVFHGALLAVHRWVTGGGKQEVAPGWMGRMARRFLMFHAVCFSWLLFRAGSMEQVGRMLAALGGGWQLDVQLWSWLAMLLVLGAPLALVQLADHLCGADDAVSRLSPVPRALAYAGCLLMLLAFPNTGTQAFIYFQF